MNRKVATWMVVIAATIGLTACSGSSEPAPAEPTAEAPEPAPVEEVEETSADPSSLQECLDLQSALAEASQAIAEIDPSSASGAEAWDEMASAFGAAADSTSNADIKSAAGAVQSDAQNIADLVRKAAGGDLDAATELMTASTDFNSSYAELLSICTP